MNSTGRLNRATVNVKAASITTSTSTHAQLGISRIFRLRCHVSHSLAASRAYHRSLLVVGIAAMVRLPSDLPRVDRVRGSSRSRTRETHNRTVVPIDPPDRVLRTLHIMKCVERFCTLPDSLAVKIGNDPIATGFAKRTSEIRVTY